MEPIICPEKYRTVTRDTIVVRKKVNDWLYILDDVNSAFMYLIIGKEKALLFDTGYGFVPFRHLIDEVTDLPLTVVCSHGHDDHVLGCFQFDTAYIAEEDYSLCMSNDNEEQRGKQILARMGKTPDIDRLVDKEAYFATSLKDCQFKFTKDGDIFDLGGITLRVYRLPGHTKGSIALYSPEKKALFTGDAMMSNHILVYAQSLEISSAPQEFIRALSVLEKLDVETVWPAHGNVPAGRELVADTRAMLIDWAHNADLEKDLNREPPKNTVFGKPGQKRYSYKYKDLTLSYHGGHLAQIREYMEKNNGEVE